VTTHRISLSGTDIRPLVQLPDDTGALRPEVVVVQLAFDGVSWVPDRDWDVQRSLLGETSSTPTDLHVTIEDGLWERIAGYRRPTDELVQIDLRTGDGSTVRFGDGQFGMVPTPASRFQVTYRIGRGRLDDLAPGSVRSLDPSPAFVESVSNPTAAVGGRDPQSLDEVRVEAPEAFRAVTYRAVTTDDYADALDRLDWVQRAGASLRWTGSWPTVFATPDPVGTTVLSTFDVTDADQQLDRFRQAGREAYVLAPHYADLDLEIHVCVATSSMRGDVEAALLVALFGVVSRRPSGPSTGLLSPDAFTFGTPLRRAALEAGLQEVPGVRAVEQLCIRRRGWFPWRPFDELVYQVAPDEVVRVTNDPDHPDWGTVRLVLEGGA
jgi:predicted phage baseplate assembly protein